jgi:orotate phosphoribosyltransferase
MSRTELAAFVREHSLTIGDFVLASGARSSFYIDGKLTTFHPRGAFLVASAILDLIAGADLHAIGGMDMGGTPMVGAIAALGFARGAPIPTFVVRKAAKGHGTKKMIEGCIPPPPARVAIVEDVVTSGGSMLHAIDVVRGEGHEVVMAIAMLDRGQGGAGLMAAHGIDYRPLLTLGDLGIG